MLQTKNPNRKKLMISAAILLLVSSFIGAGTFATFSA